LIFKVDNQSQTEHYNLGFVDGLPHAIWLDPDNWILKEVEYTSMGGILPNKPQITIYPAYPNPFNPQTLIRYFVPEQLGYVQLSISIYDIRGHIADSFDIGSILPGMHEFVWNADRQGSGIYFIQFSIEGRSYAQKIQLVK